MLNKFFVLIICCLAFNILNGQALKEPNSGPTVISIPLFGRSQVITTTPNCPMIDIREYVGKKIISVHYVVTGGSGDITVRTELGGVSGTSPTSFASSSISTPLVSSVTGVNQTITSSFQYLSVNVVTVTSSGLTGLTALIKIE